MRKRDVISIADGDDDEVRTSMSQNQVTATLRTEELFLRTQYIYLSPHISQVKMLGGGGIDSQHDTWSVPSVVLTSQLTLHAMKQGLHEFFTNIL